MRAFTTMHSARPSRGVLVAVAVMLVVAVLVFVSIHPGVAELAGAWAAAAISHAGPLAVVALMAAAVVISPIPSGPVAMAAGAMYGPWLGGGLTAAGAILGAMIAFGLSRRLGYRPLSNSSRPLAVWITKPRSQTALMLLVLVTRLIPFISFDAVSYLAGLTRIEAWRFALATIIGVTPISFAFAAIGAGLTNSEARPIALLACGVTLLLPAGALVIGMIRAARSRQAPPG